MIGNDVWIGQGATLMSGVTIGDGAIIGARSLIAKDVPPYSIAAGNPAGVRRARFEQHVVERLLALRWWDWPEEKIERFLPLMLSADVESFLREAESAG